jgi:hypothetical protein
MVKKFSIGVFCSEVIKWKQNKVIGALHSKVFSTITFLQYNWQRICMTLTMYCIMCKFHAELMTRVLANLTCIWETLGILTTLPGLDSGRLRNILTFGGGCWPLLAAVAAEGSGWRPAGPFTCEKMGLKKGG